MFVEKHFQYKYSQQTFAVKSRAMNELSDDLLLAHSRHSLQSLVVVFVEVMTDSVVNSKVVIMEERMRRRVKTRDCEKRYDCHQEV